MGFNIGNILQGAAGGAVTGSAVPGVGTVAGGIIGGVGSLFGGMFSGGVPNHEDPDEIKIAKTYGITQQQASDICGYEESHSPRNYDDICAQAASDRSFLQQIWERYNNDHPGSPILPQQPSQAVNTQAQNVAGQAQSNNQANQANTGGNSNVPGNSTPQTSKATTYALLGGGGLLLVIIAILLLKK